MSKAVDKGLWVFVPMSDEEQQIVLTRCKPDVVVEFDDGRGITAAQRRKAYVLLNAISAGLGYTPLEAVKEMSKLMFAGTGYTVTDGEFSLGDCDRTTARLYITFLIDFCLIMDIPCGEPLWKLCEDLERYTWACLMNKRCCVCGGKTELHHVDAVGMGRNRKEIIHIGMRALPLCRKHHTEIHQIGREDFLKRYIVEPVKITDDIARVYNLRG